MPLHEYERRSCGHHFEYLTRAEQSPTCPSCRGENLQKLLSVFAAHSDSPAKSFSSSPLEPVDQLRRPARPGFLLDELAVHQGHKRRIGDPVAPRNFSVDTDEAELAVAGRGERLEIEILDDVNAMRHEQMHVAEEHHVGVGIALFHRIPRHVVGANRNHAPFSGPSALPDFDTPAAFRYVASSFQQRRVAGSNQQHIARIDDDVR